MSPTDNTRITSNGHARSAASTGIENTAIASVSATNEILIHDCLSHEGRTPVRVLPS